MKRIKSMFSNIYKIIFNSANLEGNGERVDIIYKQLVDFNKLDMYEKSHFRRYEFASNYISDDDTCGDFACGTGYGSVMLAKKSLKVIGVDLNSEVIEIIKKRYKDVKNVEFVNSNLLDLKYTSIFDAIVSFETVEHLTETDIVNIFNIYNKALKRGGKIIFSTPYLQEQSKNATELGFHLTFHIDEEKIVHWLDSAGFTLESFSYQNYKTHSVEKSLTIKDFIIGVARKN